MLPSLHNCSQILILAHPSVFCLQPAWSAYREPSFGHGRLIINSPTEAKWTWIANDGSKPARVADEVTITRGACKPSE